MNSLNLELVYKTSNDKTVVLNLPYPLPGMTRATVDNVMRVILELGIFEALDGAVKKDCRYRKVESLTD